MTQNTEFAELPSSQGRAVDYEYDRGGRLIRVKDSEGHVDSYSYDDKGAMLTASHGTDAPILQNEYFSDGYFKSQTMADGRKFDVHLRSKLAQRYRREPA